MAREAATRSVGRLVLTCLSSLVYATCYVLSALCVAILFPLRLSGLCNVPRRGGLLVISNHQSYLDPIVLGLALSRSANFIAKSELFGVPPLRWLITALNAIKIEREGMTKESLRTSIDRLRNGGIVVLWPEGTRTSDGRLGPLHAGVLLLCRRAQVPAVVAGVSGSFDAWPRHQILPIPQPIWIHFDRWHYDNQASTGDNLRHLESVLQAAVNEASKRRQRFLHTKRGVSKFLERQP